MMLRIGWKRKIITNILIDKIEEKCNLRVFDFGRQDYYHDTHHIFFTNNTIFFLFMGRINQ